MEIHLWRNIWVSPQNPAEMAWNSLKCLEICWNHYVFLLSGRVGDWLQVVRGTCLLKMLAYVGTWFLLKQLPFSDMSFQLPNLPLRFLSLAWRNGTERVQLGWDTARSVVVALFLRTTIEHHNGPHRFMMRAHLHIISTFMYATLYARMYTPIPSYTSQYILCDVCCQWWYLGLFETRGARCTPSKLKIITYHYNHILFSPHNY